MAKRKRSTAELVGASHFSRNGLQTDHGELVYFLVQPTNISVLSETSIALKIQHLTQLLSVQPDIEIICSDARENFEYRPPSDSMLITSSAGTATGACGQSKNILRRPPIRRSSPASGIRKLSHSICTPAWWTVPSKARSCRTQAGRTPCSPIPTILRIWSRARATSVMWSPYSTISAGTANRFCTVRCSLNCLPTTWISCANCNPMSPWS